MTTTEKQQAKEREYQKDKLKKDHLEKDSNNIIYREENHYLG